MGLANALGIGVMINFMTGGIGKVLYAESILGRLTTKLGFTKDALVALKPVAIMLVAAIASLVVGFNMLRGAVDLASEFGDLHYQLGRTAAIYGETGDSFELYGEQVLALSTTYGYSAAEIAESLEQIARSNIRGAEAFDVLEAALQGAIVGDLAVADATSVMLSAIMSTGRGAELASETIDMMTRASHLGWIEIEDFGAALANAGLVAKSANQPFNELLASIVMLQSAGISGARSGTILRMMYQRLEAPSQRAVDIFHDLEVNMRSADGEMRSMYDIINDLQGALAVRGDNYIEETFGDPLALGNELLDMSEIAQDEAITWMQIFNRRAMQGLAVTTEMTREVNGQIVEGIDLARQLAGDIAETPAAYAKTTAMAILDEWPKQVELLSAAWNAMKLTVGQHLMEVFYPVLKAVKGFVSWVSDFMQANPNIAKVLAYGLAGGAVLLILAGGVALMAALGQALLMFGVGIGAILFPIALAVALFVALGIFILLFHKQIWAFIKFVGESLYQLLEMVISILWATLDVILAPFRWLVDRITDGIAAIMFWVHNAINDVGNWISTAVSDVGNWFSQAWDDIVGVGVSGLNVILGAVETVINGIINLINQILPFVNIGEVSIQLDQGDEAASGMASGIPEASTFEPGFVTGSYDVPEDMWARLHKHEVVTQAGAEEYQGNNTSGGIVIENMTLINQASGNLEYDVDDLFKGLLQRMDTERQRGRV